MEDDFTYRKAGVDVTAADAAKRMKSEILKQSFAARKGRIGEVVLDFGAPAALLDLSALKGYRHPLLALHTDGVGTKLVVAQLAEKYDTIGIDCVASNVNDIVCVGAEPLAMLSYEAYHELFSEEIMRHITSGLLKGAEIAGISIPGGETAVLKDILQSGTFDLAGTAVGIVEKDEAITGKNLEDGDVIIGLESSGIHTNGLTLARKVILEKAQLKVSDKLGSRTAGELLLEPTRIYARDIMSLLNENVELKYVSHITGSGFAKIARAPVAMQYEIDFLPQPHEIFGHIQRLGNVSDEEMFRTFNMGIGMCVYVARKDLDSAAAALEKMKTPFHVIGRCVASAAKQVVVKTKNVVLR